MSSPETNADGQKPKTLEDNGLLVRSLADEYKILQDKIDKIGAFRFTIKGWSTTVIIASLFAGTAANSVPPLLLLSSLFVVLGLFFYVEKKQTDLSRYFGQRTISIEAVLSRILRKSAASNEEFIVLHFIPGIAHHLGRQHPRKRKRRSKTQSFRDADLYFYLIQALVVVAVVALHGARKGP
jgi:hypothetical protein